MLVPVREYASATEMLHNLMEIRNGFRTYRPPPLPPIPDSCPEPEPPHAVAPVIFHMTADMATPPELMPKTVIWRRYTVRDILNVVCDIWGVELIDLISARRTHDVMRPRKAAYALACKFTAKSLPEIGRHMGGRDHTSVLNGKNKMRPLMDRLRERMPPDASLRQWAEELRREMGP